MKATKVVIPAVLSILGLLLVLLVMLPATDDSAGGACDGDLTEVWAADSYSGTGTTVPTVPGWSREQMKNAAAIIAAGHEIKVPARARAIAVMTAIGESSLIVVDHGDTAGPDSRGLFQQRANGAWGSYSDRMNPRISSINFYRALLRVPGWQTLPPTIAAHKTQRNADPYHYARFWGPALKIIAALEGSDAVTAMLANGAMNNCDQAAMVAGGSVVWPIPASMKGSDRHNWGRGGAMWASKHTGTDFSVPCGTPVYAAHAGIVILDHTESWAGPTLVKVSTGKGQLTTWYAHMQRVSVKEGQRVGPGSILGEVGAQGNATGCHLHFEVHPRGGTIYQDNINPSPWLVANVGKNLPGGPAQTPGGPTIPVGGPLPTKSGWFALASFNILGHSHTEPGGKRASWPDSPVRTRALVRWISAHRPDVIGMQEVQSPQFALFTALGGKAYDTWPRNPPKRGAAGHNIIAWRRASFDLLQAGYIKIPYFGGKDVPMPVALLRHRGTGRTAIFINVHNPASGQHGFGNQAHWRTIALQRERALVIRLSQRNKVPVFLTGDFNDRKTPLCVLSAGGLMSTPNGGGASGRGCVMPRQRGIDWLFSTGRAWANFSMDRRMWSARMTDHPYVTAATRL